MNNSEEIINDMQKVVEQMKLDDIEENPDSEYILFNCPACAQDKPLAGSIQYGDFRICNDCTLMYEVSLKLNKVKNIDDFMQKTEDARLSKICDFIKQDSARENN